MRCLDDDQIYIYGDFETVTSRSLSIQFGFCDSDIESHDCATEALAANFIAADPYSVVMLIN